MTLFESIEKLGRAIFELPFSSLGDVPEVAEIRLALLDAIRERTHRTGSVRVFSFDVVKLELRGVAETQARSLESGVFAEFLAKDLRTALARSSVRFSERLRVEVRTTPKLPSAGEGWAAVDVDSDPEMAPAPELHPSRTPRPARLVVTRGTANKSELILAKTRINIGRSVDVFHANGPARRNDLAFVEDTEVNRTISREHAHILTSNKTAEHRIYNDRWYKGDNCGLWILRDGLSQPVHRGDRGLVLMTGDEIYVGQAIIKFLMPSTDRTT
jgi:hypothetical protein